MTRLARFLCVAIALEIVISATARAAEEAAATAPSPPKSLGAFIGAKAAATAAAPLPGHSQHGEAFDEGPRGRAYLMGGTGKVHLAVTTEAPGVQALFDQGIGQLHGFWYLEAERSFRQAAALDPHCAWPIGAWRWPTSTTKNAPGNSSKRRRPKNRTRLPARRCGSTAWRPTTRQATRTRRPGAAIWCADWSGSCRNIPTSSKPRPSWPCRFGKTAATIWQSTAIRRSTR